MIRLTIYLEVLTLVESLPKSKNLISQYVVEIHPVQATVLVYIQLEKKSTSRYK